MSAPPGPDPGRELAAADRHIAEAEARAARQARLLERLAAGSRDTAAAADLLRGIERGLELMREHRRLILREMSGR